jgi:hypothetical protein
MSHPGVTTSLSGSRRRQAAIPTRLRSRPQPAGPQPAGTRASSARTQPRRSSAWSASRQLAARKRLPSPWPSSPTCSGPRIGCRHPPAGERTVPAVMRGLIERGLPELVVAGIAGDRRVSHAPAAAAASRAGPQMHGFQLTCALPGHSEWPNGQRSGLLSNREADTSRAAAFARRDPGGDHAPGDHLAASQLPGPRRGPGGDAGPAAADIPAIDADAGPGELVAAQLPQVLVMGDASDGSQVRSCPGERRAAIRISAGVRTLTTTA